MDLYNLYPPLCVLLTFLRCRSQVVYFSYGAVGYSQEIRWTRSKPDEDFEKDYWTLWWD